MTTLVSTKYPAQLVAYSNSELNPDCVNFLEMSHALLYGHPVLDILTTLLGLATEHGRKFGQSIAYDGNVGEVWLDCAKSARRMLDGDYGKIDNGCAEWYYDHVCTFAGYDAKEIY